MLPRFFPGAAACPGAAVLVACWVATYLLQPAMSAEYFLGYPRWGDGSRDSGATVNWRLMLGNNTPGSIALAAPFASGAGHASVDFVNAEVSPWLHETSRTVEAWRPNTEPTLSRVPLRSSADQIPMFNEWQALRWDSDLSRQHQHSQSTFVAEVSETGDETSWQDRVDDQLVEEMRHALGLSSSDDPTSLMYVEPDAADASLRELGPDDIAALPLLCCDVPEPRALAYWIGLCTALGLIARFRGTRRLMGTGQAARKSGSVRWLA